MNCDQCCHWWCYLAVLIFVYLTPVTLVQAVISAVVGTIWLGVAGLIVAQATGMTDISPMSGMALISVTLMMFLLNNNVAAAMVVGVTVCVAIGQGADMMQDLKTGFMVGARPIKQQLIQFGVTWIGSVVAVAVFISSGLVGRTEPMVLVRILRFRHRKQAH